MFLCLCRSIYAHNYMIGIIIHIVSIRVSIMIVTYEHFPGCEHGSFLVSKNIANDTTNSALQQKRRYPILVPSFPTLRCDRVLRALVCLTVLNGI